MTTHSMKPKLDSPEKVDSESAPPAGADRGIEMIAVQASSVPLTNQQAQRHESDGLNQNNLGKDSA